MSEVKPRKKGLSTGKTSEGLQKAEKHSNSGQLASPRTSSNPSSFWMDSRTSLSVISLAVCLLLTWALFHQSSRFADLEKKYSFLQREAEKFLDAEHKVNLISEKCEKTWSLIEQLEALQLRSRVGRLQEGISAERTRSSNIIRRQEELHRNLTGLFHALASVEESAASVAKNVAVTVVTVRTDVRRVSGRVSDVTALTESLQTLEEKVDKGEKKTVKMIGDLLSSSIERSTRLQSLASGNARRMERVERALSELRSDFSKHSDRLLTLEGDRAKVLKTVTFANDLKPKMYKLHKDFALLEPLVNDLTLRVGRLVEEVLQREKEIASLRENLAALTGPQAKGKNRKEGIAETSDIHR